MRVRGLMPFSNKSLLEKGLLTLRNARKYFSRLFLHLTLDKHSSHPCLCKNIFLIKNFDHIISY
jgi:hypothetical protein